MDKQELEAQRARLRASLANIVNSAQAISAEIRTMPKDRRGSSYRSLKPKSGDSIVGSKYSFRAEYTSPDGNHYEIMIYQREKPTG